LTLHGVTILRGAQSIDALEDADMDFLRVEQDMYARVYRGDYVVVIQARGVEPQDRIDFSFTIEGCNPVFGGSVAFIINHTFTVPISRRFCRVLSPPDRPEPLHASGPALAVATTVEGGMRESRVDLRDMPRRDLEYWVPAERDDQASLWTLTSYRSWSDVAQWAAELYAIAPDDPAIAELAAQARAQTVQSPELAAIAYIQERIRYVSTSFGEGGYRPRSPSLAVKRRYGDCKDKALLLCGVLRKLGHEADLALVDQQRPRGPLADHPSPLAFNHVIVRAVIKGETHWIDATATGQRGPLSLRGRPHNMAALVVRRGVEALEVIPELPEALVGDRSDGVTDLSAGLGRPALSWGESQSIGLDAEMTRRAIALHGAAGLSRMYLDVQSQEHGEAEYEEFDVKDDEARNIITIRSRLRLLDPWREAPGRTREFRSTLCYATNLLPAVPMNRRVRPVALFAHPMHHHHAETILLPRGKRPLGVRSSREQRRNSAFEFIRTETLSGGKLRVSVETRTLSTQLEAADALRGLRDQTALQSGHVLQLRFKLGLLQRMLGRR
jgi:hypothetical protein